MSSSLSYESYAPLAEDVRSSVTAHIESAAGDYDWWCEPIHFFDRPDLPEHLTGNTKLFLLHDDPSSDSFMAHADATKIVELLASASREFGISWKLSLEGAPVGNVVDGAPDADATDSLNGLLEICTMMGFDPSDFDRAEILAANPDR